MAFDARPNPINALADSMALGLRIRRMHDSVDEAEQKRGLAVAEQQRRDLETQSKLQTEQQTRDIQLQTQGEQQRQLGAAQTSSGILNRIQQSRDPEEIKAALGEFGQVVPYMDPKEARAAMQFAEHAASLNIVEAGIEKQANELEFYSQPKAGPNGEQVPGLLEPEETEALATDLNVYLEAVRAGRAPPPGTKGPDDVAAMIVDRRKKKAEEARDTALTQEMLAKKTMELQTLSQQAGFPADNIHEATGLLAFASSGKPMSLEEQKVFDKAYREALYGKPMEKEPSPFEKARKMAMEEAQAGYFDDANGVRDRAAIRAREQEILQQLSPDKPFALSRPQPTGQPAPAPGAPPAGPAMAAAAPAQPPQGSSPAQNASGRAAASPTTKFPTLDAKQIPKGDSDAALEAAAQARAAGASREQIAAFLKEAGFDPDKERPASKKPARERGREHVGPNF